MKRRDLQYDKTSLSNMLTLLLDAYKTYLGLTQKEFAEIFSISDSYLSDILNLKKPFTFGLLSKFAEVEKCTQFEIVNSARVISELMTDSVCRTNLHLTIASNLKTIIQTGGFPNIKENSNAS